MIDIPPPRSQKTIIINEYLFVGDSYVAYDCNYLHMNKITHIINADYKSVYNIFDPELLHDRNVNRI